MNRLLRPINIFLILILISTGCTDGKHSVDDLLTKYTTVELTCDLSVLTENQREMLPILIRAAQQMDAAFWMQAYGDKTTLLAEIEDPKVRQFVEYNYGPWDRLAGNQPFVPDIGAKPAGANFYPSDMTVAEFEQACSPHMGQEDAFKSLYTMVRRTPEGALITQPYSVAFSEQYMQAAELMRAAAGMAEDPGFARYLNLRADALLTDEYLASDIAWMEMRDNALDLVIGPIETYEDQLFGYKASNEAYVLVKDMEWSARLAHYAALLPALQMGLPVPEEYKQERPGTDAQLNAYDVVYYAGDCNSGSKTIAINLPNDERVQLQQGTRRLQLKNAMRVKFDKILMPIAGELIDPAQREFVDFDAFFANTMFHEIAHGLGIKNTLDGSGTVRQALKEKASALEEGKADVLGLYMIISLSDMGELDASNLMNHYVTFVTSIFRSIRFGSSSAHGIANLIRFNYFVDHGALILDTESGYYHIDPDRLKSAADALSSMILKLQGDGDYAGVTALVDDLGGMRPQLQSDLDRLAAAGIPVDVVFNQGVEVLGL